MNYYVDVLKKYTVFTGRARRKEYWMFALFNFLIGIGISIIEGILGTNIIYIVYCLAIFLPSIAVGIRRLHDTGRSGWWLLIGLIPLIGAIVLIIFFVQDSQKETNQYGPCPK